LPYLDGRKCYEGSVQLGLRTSSDDLSGSVLAEAPWPNLSADALEPWLAGFRGAQLQRPPAVSAVHVDGERAYARARRGEILDLPPRPGTIETLELTGWDPLTGRLSLRLSCSAGTYVRSLARDLGEQLGCGGCLAALRRTAALGFQLNQALELEQLSPESPLIDPIQPLGHLPQRQLLESEWLAWTRGQRLAGVVNESEQGSAFAADQAWVILRPNGSLAGMARRRPDGSLQPKLVFDAAG
jgi:tRNA pseudouridine55 synthase